MPRDAHSIMDLNGGIKYKVAYSNKKVNTCTIALFAHVRQSDCKQSEICSKSLLELLT